MSAVSSSRSFVNELSDQQGVDQVFVASDKQLRTNRQGNTYLQLDLSDRTGTINARMWNATEDVARLFDNGDYVRAVGKTQLFQGAMQLIATKIVRAKPQDVDEADFVVVSTEQMDQMAVRLAEMLRGLGNPHLRHLAETYLADEEFMRKFTTAPAGVKNHHAYRGGLLEHVVNLMEIVLLIADRYPNLDRDQLLIGAFLHDSGKIVELDSSQGLTYTDEGQLLGHIVLGFAMLDRKRAEAEAMSGERIPDELFMRIRHLIVSHHGENEFGSPTVPMTVEAIALHHLDNLDAKIHHFEQLLRDDANSASAWTQYHHNIGRKLYKGGGASSSSPAR
ncbi:MAG: HD domain-containing protein [Planctomycetota bacterium]|nr:MAG: HD domain-containing protein [Planctomycetota bacterium]REK39383.1 MAG: HD domain-containing protein [Planctomycetota bacterium]